MRAACLPLLAILLLALAPGPAAAAEEDDCADPPGDVVADDGSHPPEPLAYADILGVRTLRDAESVVVRVRHAEPPEFSSHSLSVDLDGDGEIDLAVREDAYGEFRGRTVLWTWHPVVEGNDVVYLLESDEVPRAELDGPSWTVYASSHASVGWTLYDDEIVCASGAGGLPVPGAGALLPLVAGAGAAVAASRAARRA